MKQKLVGLAVAGLLFVAGSAQAALIDVSGGAPGVLPLDFTASTAPGTGVTSGSAVTFGGALVLSASVPIVAEYLGFDAAHHNTFDLGAASFDTNTTALPAPPVVAGTYGPGAIPFMFTDVTAGISLTNGVAPVGVSIAFANLGNNSFLALFDDGGAGADWDDMVVKISAVPLPAAAWLLISAMLGLLSLSRIRRNNTQTA